MTTAQPQYQVRALERALQLLGVFSLEQPQRTLSELSMETDLAPSTTLRLLSILAQYGYVERSLDTDRFRIGVGMFERGSIYIQTTSVEAEGKEALENLARECNQTASIAVLDRMDIVHIAVEQPDRAIRYYAPVGQREMAHCTGLGKALLAGLADNALNDLIEQRGLPSRTDRTITTVTGLRSQLSLVREQGYAVDNEESVIGLRCIAAPIFNDRNQTIAALSASGPAAEFTGDTMQAITETVQTAARTVSNRLGHRVHQP